jgi:hypothetical protein
MKRLRQFCDKWGRIVGSIPFRHFANWLIWSDRQGHQNRHCGLKLLRLQEASWLVGAGNQEKHSKFHGEPAWPPGCFPAPPILARLGPGRVEDFYPRAAALFHCISYLQQMGIGQSPR